ncbi:hypothetical protein Clacol_007858 [Clathrus columnatus]|uniref:Metallo-dependent hydrolase n=1 Tax=Clathrus columnatus TaxID=1419009 RepID=A0AAV5AIT5_9AGAM|nr:hypothetical protein Clacol_007858 [Clathrus columnatus]
MPKRKQPAYVQESSCPITYPRSVEISTPIIDTHTHLLSTFQKFRQSYPNSAIDDIFSFVRWLYKPSNPKVEAIVDVWCEAPVISLWRELADSALSEDDRQQKWDGIDYWFVMGGHRYRSMSSHLLIADIGRHNAKSYNDEVEHEILRAMDHPRCVGWGEIGLDYHYDLSPREIQRQVFTRQLRHAIRLKKPLTIHTREAEPDTEAILKAEVPQDHPVRPILNPTLSTGVVTYATNTNTPDVIRNFIKSSSRLRILLETDAPYMIPSNIYRDLSTLVSSAKLPLSHTAMIPWTAEWVAKVAQEGDQTSAEVWNVERVLELGKCNAKAVYDI